MIFIFLTFQVGNGKVFLNKGLQPVFEHSKFAGPTRAISGEVIEKEAIEFNSNSKAKPGI